MMITWWLYDDFVDASMVHMYVDIIKLALASLNEYEYYDETLI